MSKSKGVSTGKARSGAGIRTLEIIDELLPDRGIKFKPLFDIGLLIAEWAGADIPEELQEAYGEGEDPTFEKIKGIASVGRAEHTKTYEGEF